MTGGNGRLWLMVPEFAFPVDPGYDYEFIPHNTKLYMRECTEMMWRYMRRDMVESLQVQKKPGFVIELDKNGARWVKAELIGDDMKLFDLFNNPIIIQGNSGPFVYYDKENRVMEGLLNKRPSWKIHPEPLINSLKR